eukprot:CAMPEP_0113936116 /NCGR_PEP_ID=MMETSP1339-20121228/3091_1 /TAXON_ID=94617 /ORGANISM="Fibrocapsa japonica" /LENGTH=238 /DNA_ID=CAMNT_0000938461 /DNA_START=398 /DNA_END=1114 /DNA_ORIENTATION=- /assembly_acc=CAM_ASM_000762
MDQEGAKSQSSPLNVTDDPHAPPKTGHESKPELPKEELTPKEKLTDTLESSKEEPTAILEGVSDLTDKVLLEPTILPERDENSVEAAKAIIVAHPNQVIRCLAERWSDRAKDPAKSAAIWLDKEKLLNCSRTRMHFLLRKSLVEAALKKENNAVLELLLLNSTQASAWAHLNWDLYQRKVEARQHTLFRSRVLRTKAEQKKGVIWVPQEQKQTAKKSTVQTVRKSRNESKIYNPIWRY